MATESVTLHSGQLRCLFSSSYRIQFKYSQTDLCCRVDALLIYAFQYNALWVLGLWICVIGNGGLAVINLLFFLSFADFQPPHFLSPVSSCMWPGHGLQPNILKDVSVPKMHPEKRGLRREDTCESKYKWEFTNASFALVISPSVVSGEDVICYSHIVNWIESKYLHYHQQILCSSDIYD